ncbi:MAG: glycosyltransferase [Pyrinomonadaceae bacterium]|nr:glycosyltransferase [Pyrinomonadaceae bacterium]
MKIVLLALDGEVNRARESLAERYPQAAIEHISRSEFESLGVRARLARLRQARPDVFAVACERLAWQRGQNAFLLFGAMAGARLCLLLDAHGGWREERRAHILTNAPARLMWEAALSGATLARSRKELRRLERTVAKNNNHGKKEKIRVGTGAPLIVYLRSTPGAGTQIGGASSHINGFVNAALKDGARISFLSNDEIAGLDEEKTRLKVIWPEPIGSTRPVFDLHNNLLFTRGAAREIADNPPDFIYQRYARFSWAGVEASLQTGRPLFLEYNGSEVWVGKHWDSVGMPVLLERCERLNLSAAARIFVVSEVERRNLLRAGVDADKIVVNPNGVDVETFRPGIGGEKERASLGLAPDETLVGFVGTFGPWHGVLALAKAITLLPADARIRFLLVGGGVLKGEVENLLREAGALERVIFAGVIAHERVPALLDACDVLASPHVPLADGSEFFGSPTKLFEYMAMGKGIVASRLGQIGDVLEDEKTALLVEPGNARELSEALQRLAHSRDLRERLGAGARSAAIARHTWEHNAARVLDAYQAWLSE